AAPHRLPPHLRPGPPLPNFSSNDYLGLAAHPDLAAAATAALSRSGVGATASRLVTGDYPEHRSLAAFPRLPAPLLSPPAYQPTRGVLPSLAGKQDLLVSDAANHASLIDGCR